jgi:hypothetical protein
VLLISCRRGLGNEDTLNPIWAERAKGHKSSGIPEQTHTGAIDLEPEEYERRFVGFLDRLLLRR